MQRMEIKGRIWTIPNILSILRFLLLMPILLLLSMEMRIHALVLMLISAATDLLDGYIARKWHQSSDLGRILDPLIDKISVLAVVFLLVVHPAYGFPLWFLVFLAVREFAILACGLYIVKKQLSIMESNRAGKNSAFVVAITVVWFVLGIQPWGWVFLWIGFALTIGSSYLYFRAFLRNLRVHGAVTTGG